MSKHLPNCPHLSEYDGLGDAGMIMAINKKHRENNSYVANNSIKQVENLYDTVESFVADVHRYENEMDEYIEYLKKDKEKCCRDAYISGYKQAKKDLKHKVYRSPYIAFMEYWDGQSQ